MFECLWSSRESGGFLDDVLLRPLALLRVQGSNAHTPSRNLTADPDLEGDCVGQHLEASCSPVVQGNQQVDERGAFCSSLAQLCLLFGAAWTPGHQASLSFTISWSLLKLIHGVSDIIQPSYPLSSPSPPALNSLPASVSFPVSQPFTSGGQSIGASASAISPSSEYSGLISFRMEWFNLPAVQGTLKNLLQQHNSKASVLWRSAFFTVFKSFLLEYSLELYSPTSFCFCSFLLWLQKISWDKYQTGCKFSGNRRW